MIFPDLITAFRQDRKAHGSLRGTDQPMLRDALGYPLAGRTGRDALAICVGFVLASLVLVRIARALWPTWLALAPTVALAVPAVLFAGYVGRVLLSSARGESEPPSIGPAAEVVRLGWRVLVVTVAYLVPPAVAFAVIGLALGTGSGTGAASGPGASGGFEWMIGGTLVLVVTAAFAYLLPPALAVAARDGVLAGFRRGSLGGIGHGAYFVAWTVSAVLVVLAWAGVGVAEPASPGGVLSAVWFAYAHVVGVRLLGRGLGASRR